MMYVYRGNCINMLPNETLYLKQGDLFLLNPNVLHRARGRGLYRAKSPVRVLTIQTSI